MEPYKFTFFNISFCILLLSLPLSFAHPKTCPANCVCTCPPPSGQSPPSNYQNQPPPSNNSPPPSDKNQPPPSQESTPPPSDNNQPPPSQGSPPPKNNKQPPPSQDSPPPENNKQPPPSQGSPPPENNKQPPPSQGSPPRENNKQPPSSQGSPPPSNDKQPPPSQESPPPSNDNQPPPGQRSPPQSNNNQPPPSQGSPPQSNDNQPPPSQGSPPQSNDNQPPPSQASPPQSNDNQPPPSQASPPSNYQSQPPSSQDSPPPSQASPPTSYSGAPPPTQENATPPTQQYNSPPSGQDSSPPTQQNSSPPPSQDSSPPTTPQYGQTPPSSQSPSSGSVVGGSFNPTFKGSFKRVCAFGDSFTDTGNAFLSGGLKSFAGGSYSTAFSGQRMSNGRLVIDFLCDSLDLPPLPAYKKSSANFSSGCNFAIAGSTALSHDFFARNQISHTLMWQNPMNFETQISWFNDFISNLACKGKSDAECRAEMENTLFWIGEFGGNDYSRTFGSRIKFTWLQQLAVNHVCRTIRAMIARGAKYIVVQGLPPVGCCPLEMALRGNNDQDSLGCSSIGNAMVKAHNTLLQMRLAEIRKEYSDCMIVYADTWNAYNTILSNYQKFGFVEPFKACCGAGGGKFNFDLHSLCGTSGTSTCKNPQQFISWDGIHLTEAMHRHLADLFFHGGFCQPSFDELVKAKVSHHVSR